MLYYIRVVIITFIFWLPNVFTLKYNLTSGTFDSFTTDINNVQVEHLLNIPYAEIPFVFEKPVMKGLNMNQKNKGFQRCVGESIYSPGTYGNFQLPNVTYISFDCLTINLYIPNTQTRSNGNLTVMFFIHGGSNAIGSSNYFDGSAMAAVGDVLIAIPNYRINILGFFHSKENNITGNYGLWDQLLALEWLHKNCLSLGCNASSITIFGHSAGAANVMLLGQSPKAQRYINRLIMQSGSALAHWAMDHGKLKTERKLKHLAINFLTYTTCEITLKFKCLEETIMDLRNINLNDTLMDSIVGTILKNVIDNSDSHQTIAFLNNIYIIDTLYHKKPKDWFLQPNARYGSKGWSFDYASCISSFSNDVFIRESTRDLLCSSVNTLVLLKFSKFFTRSNKVKNLLKCYYEPYMTNNKLNTTLVVDELKYCSNNVIHLNETSIIDTPKAQPKTNTTILLKNIVNELNSLIDDIGLLFAPVVDNDLILDSPYNLLNDEKFAKMDLMIGVTKHESFFFLEHGHKFNDIIINILAQTKLLYNITDIQPEMYQLKKSCLKYVLRKYYSKYFNSDQFERKLRSCYENEIISGYENLMLLSDYDLKLSMGNVLRSKLKHENLYKSKVYAYEFSHVSTFNYMLNDAISHSSDFSEAYKAYNKSIVPHYAELDFVFGLPILNRLKLIDTTNSSVIYNYSDLDYNLSYLMIQYWTNFAKYGDPNADISKFIWKPLTSKTPNIMLLDSHEPKLSTTLMNYYVDIHNFWYKNFTNYIINECNEVCSKSNVQINKPINILYRILQTLITPIIIFYLTF